MVKKFYRFATTHLNESRYAFLVAMKLKSRNWLNVKGNMRFSLSQTKPQFNIRIDDKHSNHHHIKKIDFLFVILNNFASNFYVAKVT